MHEKAILEIVCATIALLAIASASSMFRKKDKYIPRKSIDHIEYIPKESIVIHKKKETQKDIGIGL